MTVQQAQCITLAFLLAVTAIVIAFDVAALRAWGPDATISRVMQGVARRHSVLWPVFWLWVGILVGHLMPAE